MRNKKLDSVNERCEPATVYQPGMKRADMRRAQKAYLKQNRGYIHRGNR